MPRFLTRNSSNGRPEEVTALTTSDNAGTVILQNSAPGTEQTGYINISGTVDGGNSSSSDVGVKGTSDSSTGVIGTSNNGTGVQGTSNASRGTSGTSSSGVGVYGTSTDGVGVQGQSTNSWAGFFESSAGSGVHAKGTGSNPGLEAEQAASQTGAALHAKNSSGTIVLRANFDGSINGYVPGNAMINGHFAVWQRGTSFVSPASLAYTADRWQIQFDGGQAFTISQQSFTNGGSAGDPTLLPAEPQYFCRVQQTTQGSGATLSNFRQQLEDIRTFAGRTATLSYWARTNTGTRTVTTEITQNYGTGGTGPGGITSNTLATQSATIGTSWTKVSQTFTFTSLAGVTLGTAPFIGMKLKLPLMMAANSYIDFAFVQLELGSIATPFKWEEFQETLRRCQRYYQKSFAYATTPATNTAASQNLATLPAALSSFHYVTVPLTVPMRSSTPTIAIYNPGAANNQVRNYTRANDSASVVATSQVTSETLFQVKMGTNTGWAAGDLVAFNWTADAEL